jgi:hypothetical protein
MQALNNGPEAACQQAVSQRLIAMKNALKPVI